MNKNGKCKVIMKKVFTLFLFCVIMIGITSCLHEQGETSSDINAFETFRDIPGITDEEIAAIENLQRERDSFVYGMIPSTEAFTKDNGEVGGYAALFCDWLTNLFDIRFQPEIFFPDELFEKLDAHKADFTGSMTPTEERLKRYQMTDMIAERHIVTLRLAGSRELYQIKVERPLKYVFLTDARIIEENVALVTEPDTYEPIWAENYQEAYHFLENGDADAFVGPYAATAPFIEYGGFILEDYYPLIFERVSMATANPELEPVLSVVTKALRNGAKPYLNHLYSQGHDEYRKYKFIMSLDEEEKAYLQNTVSVPLAVQYFNYPIVFYNQHERKWDGITFDLLREAEKITGLTFEVINDEYTDMADLMAMLNDGRAYMFSDLIFTPEREPYYIWAEYKFMSDQFALLSKIDYPNVNINEIPYEHVALIKNTAHAEMFRAWFPDAVNVTEHENADAAFLALEKDEVKMVMAAKSKLLYYSNYYEFSGYKANYLFNHFYMSAFAFNKDQSVLRAIMDKALLVIDTDRFVDQWITKTYDYKAQILLAQRPWLIGATFLSLAVIVLILVMFYFVSVSRRAIKQSEERLQIILDAMPISFHLINQNYEIYSCNQEAVNFFGASDKADLIKRYDYIFPELQPDGRRTMDLRTEILDKAFNEGWLRMECMHQSLDNEPMPLPSEITLIRIRHKGDIIVAACSRDLREQKAYIEEMRRAEIAEKSNEAKTRFLAMISHEIRTPMNAIIGMTELALRNSEPESKNEHILTVKQASENLLSIINDILDFSKIDKGKLEIIPAYYSVSSLINDLVSMIKMRVLNSRIRFVVNIDSHIPNTLFGDVNRIRQAALNLLSNAVKYTVKGFVSFSVYYDFIDGSAINLVMEVVDSGIGIKQEDLEKLFDDYTQFDIEKNKGIEGIGLGLSITNSIIKAMCGTISVQSKYGAGSTFTMTVPQKYHTRDTLAVVDNPKDKSVLLFERREVYANSIVYTINNLGASCAIVASDSEMYEKLKNRTFDFLFISFALYKKNEEVISELGNNMKVVVLTEFGEAIPNKDINVLAMPAYSVSIASILNGLSEKFTYRGNNEISTGFTAPDAKILVVDDINTNLKVAQGLLMPYNMQIDLCKSGKEAIEAIKSQDYDLVFMDNKMPEMNGIEAVSLIREMGDRDSYYRNVPIVALTAEALVGTKERFLENGFNDFLSKPIDSVKLNTILEKMIPKEKQIDFDVKNKEIL